MPTDHPLKVLLVPEVDPNNLHKTLEASLKGLGDTFGKIAGQGLKGGFSAAKGESLKLVKDRHVAQLKAQHLEMEALRDEMMKLHREGAKDDLVNAKRNALQKKNLELHSLMEIQKKEVAGIAKVAERRMEAAKEEQKLREAGMIAAGEKFHEKVQGAFDDIKTGNITSLFKKIRAGAQAMGDKAQARGGAMGSAAEGIGGILTKIGPALMMIGALVGAVAALVKLVIEADSKAKELNKTLLDSGVSAADLASKYGDVTKSLDTARGAFQSGDGAFSFNRIWGTTAADHLKILGAYAQAGLTFKEITGAVKGEADQMNKLREATQGALTYSKLLGESAETVATNMADMMEEMGLSLSGVNERFSEITKAAQESGFSTKRFYGMVLQATSGMSMYNVRLEDTVGLLGKLGKLLGPKAGAEMTQGLNKGFKDMSYQDRYKLALTSGKGGAKAVRDSSTRQTADVQRKMADFYKDSLAKGDKKGEQFANAMKDAGFDPKDTADEMSDKFSKMTDRQMAVLRTELEGANADLARQMMSVYRVSIGRGGGPAAVAAALPDLDATGALMMKMNSILAITHKRTTEEARRSPTGQMVAQQVGGVTPQEWEQMKTIEDVFQGLNGSIEKLKQSLDKMKSPDERKKAIEAWNASVGKSQNVKLDPGDVSKVLSATTGETLDTKSMDAVVANWSAKSATEDVAEQVKEDILLARTVADNTTEMTRLLEQGVEYLLGKIQEHTEAIRNFLTGGMSDDEKRDKQAVLDKANAEIDALKEKDMKLGQSIREEKTKLLGAKPSERKAIQENLDALLGQKKASGIDLEVARARKAGVQEMGAKGRFTDNEVADFEAGGAEAAAAKRREISLASMSSEDRHAMELAKKAAGDKARADAIKTNKGIEKAYAMGGGEGVPMTLDVDEEAKKAELEVEKKALDDNLKKSAKKDDKRSKDEVAGIGKVFQDMMDLQETMKLGGALASMGIANPADVAKALRAGDASNIDAATQRKILDNPNASGSLGKGGLDALTGIKHDFVIRGGNQGVAVSAIDPADDVYGLKSGGAVDRSRRGGGTKVINNYFYGSGRETFNSMGKFEDAMGGRD